jgi:hypothetical protein
VKDNAMSEFCLNNKLTLDRRVENRDSAVRISKPSSSSSSSSSAELRLSLCSSGGRRLGLELL